MRPDPLPPPRLAPAHDRRARRAPFQWARFPRTSSLRDSAILLLALAPLAIALPAGCARGRPAGPASSDPESRAGDPSESGRRSLSEIRSAGDINGIEVRTWSIDPLGAPLSSALTPYTIETAPEGIPIADVQAWRDQGFRLVEVPVPVIDQLETTLPHIDSIRRVWLGQPTRWSEVAARALADDRGALGGQATPVRAELSVRSWLEPGVRRRPIRVELAFTGRPLDRSKSPPLLLGDLFLSHRLAPGVALAIVPAAPDELWLPDNTTPAAPPDATPAAGNRPGPEPPGARETSPGAEADTGTDGGADTGADTGAHTGAGVALLPAPTIDSGPLPEGAAGPVLFAPVSFGEAMLFREGRIRSRPPRASREVIVIVPAAR